MDAPARAYLFVREMARDEPSVAQTSVKTIGVIIAGSSFGRMTCLTRSVAAGGVDGGPGPADAHLGVGIGWKQQLNLRRT